MVRMVVFIRWKNGQMTLMFLTRYRINRPGEAENLAVKLQIVQILLLLEYAKFPKRKRQKNVLKL